MKTIEEVASEYLEEMCDEENVQVEFAFKAGVRFAQEWISVENRLPENHKAVLVKVKCEPCNKEEFEIISMGDYYDYKESRFEGWNIFHNLIQRGFHCSSYKVTHWRPIEFE